MKWKEVAEIIKKVWEKDIKVDDGRYYKNHIKNVLEFTNKNRSKAAEILHISRVNLISKIKKYKIKHKKSNG